MHDQHEGDAGLDAAPQGASDDGRPDVEQDPDAEDTMGGGQHHESGAGTGDEPLEGGDPTDTDPEQADPESGAAAEQSERSDAGHS